MLHATNNTFANIPYYGCLPMMQTNFGGDLQLCTIEPYAGYNIGYNLNPVAQQTWGGSIFNPGQAATCYAANPFSNGGCSSTPVSSGIPTPGTQGFNDAVRRGASQIVGKVLNTMTSQNLNRCLANIQQAKTALEAQLTNTNITDDQKKQVNDMLDKVKAQEEELKKIAESSDLDPKTAYEKVGEQEKALRQILVDTSKLIKDINTPASSSTGETTTTSTGETTTAGETTTTSTTGTAAAHSATTPEGASTDESSEVDENGEIKNPANNVDVFSWVQKFYNATYGGWSTDNDTFNAVCDQINKDTVMPLMISWNANKSKEKGESFMDAFLWDADRDQKIKYGSQIAGELRKKAMELGINDNPELQEAFAKIDHEMNSLFWVDNDKASEGFNKAIEIIAKKMGGEYAKYATPNKKS